MLERTNSSGVLRDARRDWTTAKLVDTAVAAVADIGMGEAAAFLHNHGVSFGVTVRTLNEANLRRPPTPDGPYSTLAWPYLLNVS